MRRKRYSPEKIIGMLREAQVALAQGMTVGKICRQLSISEQTCYRWRKEYNSVRPHSSLGYKPPAPEAIKFLIFEPIWFTSIREKMPQILT